MTSFWVCNAPTDFKSSVANVRLVPLSQLPDICAESLDRILRDGKDLPYGVGTNPITNTYRTWNEESSAI